MTDLRSECRTQRLPARAVNLTVVIPHFNQSHILPRAVASVVGDDMGDTEIIIVDDGSTDGAEDVLVALEQAVHSSLRVIRLAQNRGVAAALNIGLSAARGRFIAFLGADDFVMPGCYQTIIAALERHPSAALACGEIALVSTHGIVHGIRPLTLPAWYESYLTPATIRRRISRTDNWICNTATVHRTEVIRSAGGFDPTLGAFCDGFVCRVLAFTYGFVFVPGVYGVWQTAANTFSASSMLDRQESARLVALAEKLLLASEVGKTAPEYPALFCRRFRFNAARMHLIWNGVHADPVLIAEAAGGNERDERVLATIKRGIGFGSLGRTVALCWLVVRLRPFAFKTLLINLIRNKWVFLRNRARIEARLRQLHRIRYQLMGEGGA